jgi:phosphotransacetylase
LSALAAVFERTRGRQPRVALIGQGEGLMETTADRLAADGLGASTIVGLGGVDPSADRRLGEVAQVLRDRWPERVRDGIHALDLAANPLLFAAGLTASGAVDVCVAGTAVPVDSLEEAARWLIGPDRSVRGRGSVCYVQTHDDRLLAFAVPDTAGPLDAKGVAQLALTAASHRHHATGEAARVAFLVAPPSQDASHADAELVLASFRALAPGMTASVEWDWSTAPEDPAGRTRFRSRPNVLIFPDPVAAHLALLLIRDAAGLRTWGPLFPGGRWVLAGVSEGEATDVMTVAALAGAGLTGA